MSYTQENNSGDSKTAAQIFESVLHKKAASVLETNDLDSEERLLRDSLANDIKKRGGFFVVAATSSNTRGLRKISGGTKPLATIREEE